MSALGYYLERAGIMTTGISLVRENTQAMQPPRALWVPFPLGRPLGIPNDIAFQHRVIRAALALLDYDEGPVLVDYPEEAQAPNIETNLACPVSFNTTTTQEQSWHNVLGEELAQLRPWYELSKRRRKGRTLVGISEDSIEDILAELGQLLDANALPTKNLKWFKLAIEDAKVFYIEALTAQPGDYSAEAIEQTLWHKTALGTGLQIFYEHFAATPNLAIVARLIASRRAIGAATGGAITARPTDNKET